MSSQYNQEYNKQIKAEDLRQGKTPQEMLEKIN